MIPLENTIGGPVNNYADEPLARKGAALSDNGVELVSLHERPEMTFPGSYVYLIECTNAGYAEFAALAATEGFECRCCGAFPVKPLRRLIELQTRSSRMAA